MKKLNYLIADKCPLYRYGIILSLNNTGEEFTYLEIGKDKEFLQVLAKNIDLIVLDAGLISLEILWLFKREIQALSVPVLVTFDEATEGAIEIAKLLDARGFFDKRLGSAEFNKAVSISLKEDKCFFIYSEESTSTHFKKITDQQLSSLTRKEKHVLHRLMIGGLNKEIAYDMGLTESTIKSHVSNIIKKLNVTNRTEIIIGLNQRHETRSNLQLVS